MNKPLKDLVAGDSNVAAPEFPVLHISNRLVSTAICLPDAEKGYYRGTRFDWSGVINSLISRKHCYISEWQAQHNPLAHDGLTGPADEFTQIGYEQACTGGEFLKIGIGTLRKSSDLPYDRFKLYDIADPGIWDITAGTDFIEFQHLLRNGRYGYDYRKILRLTDAPGLRIQYELTNLGSAHLTGYVYNHNFFTLGGMATGADTSIRFPFRPEGNWRESYDNVELTSDGIAFNRDLRQSESVFMGELRGHDPATPEYGFTIRNLNNGTGINVSGSGELSHMVFWACPSVACIEPYIRLCILPGKTSIWHIDYKLLDQSILT